MRFFSFNKSKRNYSDPEKPRYAGFDRASQPENNPVHFRMVSYNIEYAKKIPEAARLLAAMNSEKSLDVICLQEMDHVGVAALAQRLDCNYVYYPSVLHPRHEKDFGNAILSKWPMVADGKVVMPQDARKLQRLAVWTKIQLQGKSIAVYSLHLKVFLKPQLRSKQIESLITVLPQDVSGVVIAGDFNTFNSIQSAAIAAPLEAAQFTQACEKIPWTCRTRFLWCPKKKLDYVWVKGMDVIDSGMVWETSASDHVPIWADLRFSNA